MNDPLLTLTVLGVVVGAALIVLARLIPDEYDQPALVRRSSKRRR
jgi:hypothetical protein